MGELLLLEEHTWEEAAKIIPAADACIVPFGSFEQHGPHLPLNTDTLIAAGILTSFGEYIETANIPLHLVCLPVFPFGMSQEHASFPGTLSLGKESFEGYIWSTAVRLTELGAKSIVLFNCHGGNTHYLHVAMKELRAEKGIIPVLIDVYSTNAVTWIADPLDYHAGKLETSLMQSLFPDIVRRDREPGEWTNDNEKADIAHIGISWQSSDFSDSGIIGDAASADPGLGQRILEELLQEVQGILEKVKRLNSV